MILLFYCVYVCVCVNPLKHFIWKLYFIYSLSCINLKWRLKIDLPDVENLEKFYNSVKSQYVYWCMSLAKSISLNAQLLFLAYWIVTKEFKSKRTALFSFSKVKLTMAFIYRWVLKLIGTQLKSIYFFLSLSLFFSSETERYE